MRLCFRICLGFATLDGRRTREETLWSDDGDAVCGVTDKSPIHLHLFGLSVWICDVAFGERRTRDGERHWPRSRDSPRHLEVLSETLDESVISTVLGGPIERGKHCAEPTVSILLTDILRRVKRRGLELLHRVLASLDVRRPLVSHVLD